MKGGALRSFVVGMFTRHLGTKALSLILSVVLFTFAFKNLSGDRVIRKVTLDVTLARALQERYVLLTESVELRDLRIAGVRAKVDEAARGLELRGSVDFGIDEGVLTPFGGAEGGKPIRIPIDREFFRTHAILTEGVDLANEVDGAPALLLDPRVKVDFAVAVPQEILDKHTALDETTNYKPVGGESRVNLKFLVPRVTLAGPQRFLGNPDAGKPRTLYVRIRNLNDVVKGAPPPRVFPNLNEVTIDDVEWKASKVDADGERFFTVLEPRDTPIDLLKERIRFTFAVEARGEIVDVPGLDILLRLPGALLAEDRREFLDRYKIDRPPAFEFEPNDVREGKCGRLKLRVPKDLAQERDSFKRRFVVVVDVANWRAKEKDTTFDAPVYLAARDPKDRISVEMLARVSIDAPDPVLIFTRQP
ncbi:MAG: hypothetical protein ACREID_01915 [Planctomycetota bacterium]